MAHLPVVIIGNILSLVGARDGVLASTTCKTWREAWRNHLHALSFDYELRCKYSASQLEIIITETVLQTTGLEYLSICMEEDEEDSSDEEYLPDVDSSNEEDSFDADLSDVDPLSAATVIDWLMYTRDTLMRLRFNGTTSPRTDILEKCSKQKKLQDLVLCHTHIPKAGVNGTYRALKSLTLSYVTISPLNLSLFLTSCPKLEALSLIAPYLSKKATMKLTSASLKDIFVKSLRLDNFIMEADGIENLHLKRCTLELLELTGKESLRVLHIDHCKISEVKMDENAGNVEVFDVNYFTITWPRFYRMISRMSKLRELRLWGIEFKEEYSHPFPGPLSFDWESIFVCLPELSQLSLSDLALFFSSLLVCFPSLSQPSSSYLQNVTVTRVHCGYQSLLRPGFGNVTKMPQFEEIGCL